MLVARVSAWKNLFGDNGAGIALRTVDMDGSFITTLYDGTAGFSGWQ